jgi:hypothetical protein
MRSRLAKQEKGMAVERELMALREQSLTHVKERVALKSILEDKVCALIVDIGQSLSELPFEVRNCVGPPSSATSKGDCAVRGPPCIWE